MQPNHLIQATIDAFATNVCIVDEHGTIRGVNAAWKSYGVAHRFDPTTCGVGASYVEVCRAVKGEEERAVAHTIGEAILDVARGRVDQFVFQYPSRVQNRTEWWVARISRFPTERPVRVLISHEDITGFKGDVDAPLSEEWLRKMIQILPTGAAYVRGNEIALNGALEDLTGYRQSDVKTLDDWLCAVHGTARVREVLGDVREACVRNPGELPLVHRDGSRRWTLFNVLPCGEGAVWLFHDVTAQKDLQIALGQREEMSREIVDSAPVGLLEVSSAGSVLFANAHARALSRRMHRSFRDRIATWFEGAVDGNGEPLARGEDPVSRCLATSSSQAPRTVGLRDTEGGLLWTIMSAEPLVERPERPRNGAVVSLLDATRMMALRAV